MSKVQREKEKFTMVKPGFNDYLVRGTIDFELQVESVIDEAEAYRLANTVTITLSDWTKGHVHVYDEDLEIDDPDENEVDEDD
jgi:maltoporin